MNNSINIRKNLFETEKISLLIISIIVIVNTGANGLVVLLSSSNEITYFMQQLFLNISLFGFVYLIMYSINQVITSIPFLVSLNCPRKLLAKNIVFTGLSRGFFITLLVLLTRIIVFNPEIGLDIYPIILGLNSGSRSITDLSIFAGIIFVLLYFIYSLTVLISFLGVKYGWEYVLTAIFVILGIGFLSFKALVLLFVFGRQLSLFILLLLFLNIIFSLLNYRFILNYEYKL